MSSFVLPVFFEVSVTFVLCVLLSSVFLNIPVHTPDFTTKTVPENETIPKTVMMVLMIMLLMMMMMIMMMMKKKKKKKKKK